MSGRDRSDLPERLLVAFEDRWRVPPQSEPAAATVDSADTRTPPEASAGEVIASRWTLQRSNDVEHARTSAADEYTVGIALKSTHVHFRSDSVNFNGQIFPGSTQVTAPGESAKAVFPGGCDVIHLFVQRSMLQRHYEETFGHPFASEIMSATQPVRVSAIERLAKMLVEVQRENLAFASLYVDSVCTAIVARLLETHFSRPALLPASRESTLPGWRLRRATEFIDAHLSEPVRLLDIASSVGLSRMHFAAQFRRATGYSPHTFLLRRRVERAQHLLRHSDMTMLDIAIDCGFRSQSHFTTVFGRVVGDTPRIWRLKTWLA